MKKAIVRRVLVSMPKDAIYSYCGIRFPGQDEDGYGKKITTRYMVQIEGSTRWYRVYCCIFSNIGTLYIKTRQGDLIVEDSDLNTRI